jgi:hypothetical protein
MYVISYNFLSKYVQKNKINGRFLFRWNFLCLIFFISIYFFKKIRN